MLLLNNYKKINKQFVPKNDKIFMTYYTKKITIVCSVDIKFTCASLNIV